MKPSVLVTRAIFPEVIARLSEYFDVVSNQGDLIFSPDQMVDLLHDRDAVLTTASEKITPDLLSVCQRLKVICNMAVGYNNIDVAAATAAGIMVTNTPDVLNETTADFGWALLMAAARRVTESEHWLRAGQWQKWHYESFLGQDIHGSTLGIVGMGRIGQAIARRSIGFDMNVLYHNRSQLSPEREAYANNARFSSLEEVLKQSDHVILMVPYSDATHHLIGKKELALMKPTATLVNIARGGVVDDNALIVALEQGTIAAAGLDVYENEPALHPGFLSLPNVVLTPHIGSASRATRLAMANRAADNMIAALTGIVPPHLVNTPVMTQDNLRWEELAK